MFTVSAIEPGNFGSRGVGHLARRTLERFGASEFKSASWSGLDRDPDQLTHEPQQASG
jgi:hypothetical protein